MNRLLLILLSQLAISTSLIATTNVHAANDLERWNSDVGRTVRQSHSEKLAQTTYKELDSRNVTVSQDMKTVYPQIETRSQVAGSRTRVVAEATLVADKDKVWRDWNKKLNKWGPKLGAAAVVVEIGGRIMDAVDWVMDPENNTIKKKPTDDQVQPHHEYRWYQINLGKYFSSYQAAADAFARFACEPGKQRENCVVSSYQNDGVTRIIFTISFYNTATKKDGTLSNNTARSNNPSYNPSAPPPENTVVSEAEIEQALRNILNDPSKADLARDMIGNTYSIGPDNPDADPDVVNDLKNAQKDVLKSDNPKGDGKTRTDPKIDTGTQGQADTTPKPDTGTGANPDPGTTPTPNPNPNTGSTTTFTFAPLCDYAAKFCDWMDWTKEEPELEEDSELEIEEQELIDYEYSDHIKFDASCPFKPRQEIFPLGALGDMRVEVDFSYFCEIATMMKSFVVALSGFIAVLMLAYAAKDI